MVTLVSPTLGRHFGQLLGRFLENHRDPLKRISWLLLADLRTLRIEHRTWFELRIPFRRMPGFLRVGSTKSSEGL